MAGNVILLVEDNPDDIELTLEALKDNNISNEIYVARDGEEAIDYLFGSEERGVEPVKELPIVVLLDLKLPKLNGQEVLRIIRSHDHARFMPVVILTSSREERDLLESYESGANSYIQKPVDFNDFVDAVKCMGLYWLLLNVTPSSKKVDNHETDKGSDS